MLEEAEFYNITSLIKLVKDKIRERDCKTSQVSEVSVCLFVRQICDSVMMQRKFLLLRAITSIQTYEHMVPWLFVVL